MPNTDELCYNRILEEADRFWSEFDDEDEDVLTDLDDREDDEMYFPFYLGDDDCEWLALD